MPGCGWRLDSIQAVVPEGAGAQERGGRFGRLGFAGADFLAVVRGFVFLGVVAVGFSPVVRGFGVDRDLDRAGWGWSGRVSLSLSWSAARGNNKS